MISGAGPGSRLIYNYMQLSPLWFYRCLFNHDIKNAEGTLNHAFNRAVGGSSLPSEPK